MLLRDGRRRRAVHHRHRHHLAVAPSIAVAIAPSITVAATALPSCRPSLLPQCRPLLAASPRCRRTVYHRCCSSILSFVVVNSFPLLLHFLLMIIVNLFRLIAVSIDPAYIGGDGSNGTVVVIVALVVVPLYSSPEAPLLHVSIANWQAFDLIRMHSTLL